ncbi:MAG: hypothetical protein KBT58_07390, partial [Bizionia sp.]|nr:hypothetical protein [Bizionia sp.]
MADTNANPFLNALFNQSSPTPLETLENNVYTNHLFGISLQIPEGWYVVSAEKFNIQGRKQTLNDGFEDMKMELFEMIGSPILTITKHDPDNTIFDGIVSPTINFNMDVKEVEYKDMSLFAFANALDVEDEVCALKDFKILKKGPLFKISDFDCIQFDTEYLFEHEELSDAVKVEMSVLNIDYK